MNLCILCAFFICSPALLDGTKWKRPRSPPTCSWKTDREPNVWTAAITVDNKLVSVGVVMTLRNHPIVTSANPIERYLTWKGPKKTDYIDRDNRIIIYDSHYNYGRCTRIEVIGYSANISKRNSSWIRMGFDRDHSPIHDLIFIFRKPEKIARTISYRRRQWNVDEYSFFELSSVYKRNTWEFETKTWDGYAEEVDCDEWIPRAWGRFVCIKDVDNRHEIQSGTSLLAYVPKKNYFHIKGIGCFSLTKGEESILVFTAFDEYFWIQQKHTVRIYSTKN